MLSVDERTSLIKQYAAGPTRLKAALNLVPAAALQWRPAPAEWSAHEVIMHCADSEAISVGRIRYLLAEREVRIAGYDEAAWATTFDYHQLPLEPALATIAAVRANTVPMLEQLGGVAWASAGEHSEFGSYSVDDWLRSYAEHLELHIVQLQQNIVAWDIHMKAVV